MKLSVKIVLLTRVICSTTAVSDTMKACVSAQEVLFENIELDNAFKEMLQAYNQTCHDEDLCTYDIDSDTMTGLKPKADGSAPNPNDLPKIKGSGNAYFGGAFQNHDSYLMYKTSCSDAGGDVACVDAKVILEGNAGGAFLPDSTGIETDVKVTVTSFPMCMVRECENEDMTKILENTGKNAILKSDRVSEDLDSQTESMIKAATTTQVCALSGLETCEVTVERKQTCSAMVAAGGSSKTEAIGFGLGTVVLVGLAIFARRQYKRRTGGDIEMQTP